MDISVNAMAYGAVVVAGLALFTIGKPDEKAQQMASVAPVPATEAGQAALASSITMDSVTLRSVSLDLPESQRTFPGGAEADAINNNCLVCHSAGMVLNQPALPRATWTAEVNKMIDAYKAPVAPEDVGAIIDYLSRFHGTK